VVFCVRPVADVETVTGLLPDPGAAVHGALSPQLAVVPYSNLQLLTSTPLGFTVALKVAASELTAEAEPVTDGRRQEYIVSVEGAAGGGAPLRR
jgi:hypothetical protein